MKTFAKIDFSGPNNCCFAVIDWPLQSLGRSNNDVPVLRMQKSPDKFYYVSVITSTIENRKGNQNTLRLNGKFARALGFSEGDEIFVEEIMSQCNTIKRAFLSCVSVDDWEILESNAEIVSNRLLDQLRVVSHGLKFPFWVTKSMSIELKIEKIDSGVEFGLLTNTSEIEIPSLKSTSESTIMFNTRKILRIHPIMLPHSAAVLPSSALFLNNIHHALAFKSSIITDKSSDDEDSSNSKYFCAQIIPHNTLLPDGKNTTIVKVFFIDNIDCGPNLSKHFDFVTNPHCLFLHPKLVEKFKIDVKTYVMLEPVSSQIFENIPSQFSPIDSMSKTEKKFGGFADLVDECCNFLKASLSLGSIRHGFIGPVGSLLITGKAGSGKTTLSQHVVRQLDGQPYFIHWELVSCSRLKGKKPETMEKELQSVMSKASRMAPSVVILDDLDIITGIDKSEQQNAQEEFLHYKTCETIAECVLEYSGHQITIIATAEREETLNSYWKSRPGFHFFQKTIHIPPANKLDRLLIFEMCTDRYLRFTDSSNVLHLGVNENAAHDNNVRMRSFCRSRNESMKEEISGLLSTLHDHYATPRIIENISRKWALHILDCSANNDKNLPFPTRACDLNNFEHIIKDELRFCEEYSQKDNHNIISWDKIGGMGKVKHEIKKILEWPIKYPMLFDNAPIKMPSGILLYGYPGTGKTLIGLTIPSQVNAKFIHIKGPELLSKYIGASEQAVQDVFTRARNSKPCILFFDEFDSLVPRRGHDSTGVTDRVVNQFLAEMDGIEGGLGQGVYLIAATSRPDLIDPAVLRPGRLDKHLFFDLPTKEERFDILKNISSQVNHSYDESDMDAISFQAKGFTGADIHALISTSQLASVQQYLGKLELNECDGNGMETGADAEPLEKNISVTKEHLEASFKTFKPTLQGEELLKFRFIYESFSSKNVGNDGNISTSGRFIMETGKRATLA